MSAPKIYHVEFTEAEMYGLVECLTYLRSSYLNDMSVSDARHHPVFVQACELRERLSKELAPDSETSWAMYSPPG